MEEPKTILEWLQTLPDDHPKYGNIRERAILYTENCPLYTGGKEAISLRLAMADAFFAVNTPEGYDWWMMVKKEIEAGTLFDYQKEPEITHTEGEGMTVRLPQPEGPVIINRAQYNPWISVKDRLPEQNKHVYVSRHGLQAGDHRQAYLIGNDWFEYFLGLHQIIDFAPTHWMEKSFIPEPPKE